LAFVFFTFFFSFFNNPILFKINNFKAENQCTNKQTYENSNRQKTLFYRKSVHRCTDAHLFQFFFTKKKNNMKRAYDEGDDVQKLENEFEDLKQVCFFVFSFVL